MTYEEHCLAIQRAVWHALESDIEADDIKEIVNDAIEDAS